MDQEQSSGKCEGCEETEPSFIHTVNEDDVFRRFCTDCLLKDDEHKRRFCLICITVYDVPHPNDRIICVKCTVSTHHRDCLPPPPPNPNPNPIYTCQPCSDDGFAFFPRQRMHQLIDIGSAKALVAAAKLAMENLDQEVTLLKKIADEKISESAIAKAELWDLQETLFQQEVSSSELYNPKRRKISQDI
ncbi:unnamed protein product [Cochlearia groenlandica]